MIKARCWFLLPMPVSPASWGSQSDGRGCAMKHQKLYRPPSSKAGKSRLPSRLFGLRLVVVIVLLVALLLGLALGGLLGLLVRLLLLGLLDRAQGLPLLREGVGRDDDVVEDRAALHLPQVEAEESEVL